MQRCPVCNERRAAPQYYRMNQLTEQMEHLCRACWLTLRKVERSDWVYFRGAARLLLLYTVLPVMITALVVWLLVTWLI